MGSSFERNLAAFTRAFPGCATLLPTGEQTVAKIIYDDGRPVDVEVGNGRLYGMSGEEFAATQVAKYLASPVRVLANHPTGVNLESTYSVRMVEKVAREILRREIHASKHPVPQAGYLIVLGVGLGFHLLPLVRETQVKDVIIAEAHAEFCRHSLLTADWSAIVDLCEEKGIRLHMVIATTPEAIADGIGKVLNNRDAIFLDGTYFFTHYASWVHNKVQERVYGSLNHYYISRGYYEDELKMLLNATGNLAENDCRLITTRPRSQRPEPVFIIGSGPSIEKDIEAIRKWKDHALILSCGSALQVLLSHGIQPDFQVELENGQHLVDVASHVSEKYKIKDIDLIASATVPKELARFYRSAHFFFRDSVSSTAMYSNGVGFLRGTAPTAVNSGVAVAVAWGFRDIYLFGVDCGSKVQINHSPRSIYHTMEEFKKQESEAPEFNIELEGNLGGTARTNWVYDMSRRMLQVLQKTSKCNLFNCSDGARIIGAKPKLSKSIVLANAPLDKQAVKAQATRFDIPFQAGNFFRKAPLLPNVELCGQLDAELASLFDAAEKEDRDLASFFDRVSTYLSEATGRFCGIPRVFSGSAYGLIRVASFFINRVVDDADRYAIFKFFMSEYRAIMAEMTAGTRTVLLTASNLAAEPPTETCAVPAEQGSATAS